MATHYLYPLPGRHSSGFATEPRESCSYNLARRVMLSRGRGSECGDPFTPGRSDALVCSPGGADITGENRRLTIDQ